eukprot:gene68483-93847_t
MHIRQLIISLIVLLFSTLTANSQTATQTIRGTVLDKVSQAPLIGALLIVQDITPTIGTTSDENGNFTLKEVPVGKRTIKVTYMGYKEQLLQNLTVNAGKEL